MREIVPINNNNSIQLKFSFGGKRYSFNPIPGGDYDNKRDLNTAKAIATKIQNDILAGYFDTTLDRYRLCPKNCPKPTVEYKYLLEVWDLWVGSLRLPPETLAAHYKYCRIAIAKANPKLMETNWITEADLAHRTKRDRLSMLRSCFRWAIDQGMVENNPYVGIKLRKPIQRAIKPFTGSETIAIIQGFDSLAPHYTPFVKFLFLTGVRISEAIGLRWSDIDFERSEMTIAESLSKDVLGNGYERVRKSTKTGVVRYLTISPQILEVLQAVDKKYDLVFTSPAGTNIDADNFRARQWKPVLEAVKVPYRKIHNIRHTLASHALEQQMSPASVAYLLGHVDSRMVVTTYGHIIDRPDLPKIF